MAGLAAGELLVRSQPNKYSLKRDFILHRGDRITTVVLGSSHTYYAIIPDSLGDVSVNLANVSQNFEYDFRLLDHFLPYMPGLKKVIVPVSYFSFFDPPFDITDEWFFEIYYKVYMDIDKYPLISKYSAEICKYNIYAGRIRAIVMNDYPARCTPDGFGLDKPFEHKPVWTEEMRRNSTRHHTARDFSFERHNAAWLDSLLNLCHDRNIEVVFITTPVSACYRSHLEPHQLKRFMFLTDSIVRSRRIRWLDYSADERFSDDDFYDPDHLCDRGARRFTSILRDTLIQISPYIRRPR